MIRIPENLSTKLSILVNSSFSVLHVCALQCIKVLIKKAIAFRRKPHDLATEKLHTCWLCSETFLSKRHAYFCRPCRKDLPVIRNACFCCSLPLNMMPRYEADSRLISRRLCGECISQPPGFICTVASYSYSFPLKELIRRIKYRKQRYWLKPLSSQLIADIKSAPAYAGEAFPELLIPIPMHSRNQKDRTFNQAKLIANAISRTLNIPVSTAILLKTKETDNQAGLNKAERIRNLQQAFSLSAKAQRKKLVQGKHIALIDDVMTTKATAQLATKVLLEAGASRIDVWCLARTPKT